MLTRTGSLFARLGHGASNLPMLIEAVACLLAARLVLRRLSGGHTDRLLIPLRGRRMTRPANPRTLARIRWSVQTAARYVPCRALCFERGVAAQRMLLRRGFAAELVYGVAWKPNGSIEAHVWTRVGHATVVGGQACNRFAPVAVFTADARVVAYAEPTP
jgi:Transglutaminase-like superfamily